MNHGSAFEKALHEFKKDLTRRDQQNFKITTFKDLEESIVKLQTKQHSQRRLQGLIRLKPFLEGMEQYGKVVEVFCNSNEVVAFVWVASTYANAFTELLDRYEEIGENLPLLVQYQDLFHVKPHMVRVLSLMYEDILKFHRIALQYFHQPLWKQIFDATWKTYRSRFSGIISNMTRHRLLIERQATLSQIEEFRESRRIEDERFEANLKEENLRRSQIVYDWLRGTDVDTDQYHFSKIRAEYPGTGQWLLNNSSFTEWFDPQYPTIPPLLWLKGIPGAGKTILASLVVEEARKLTPAPTVLFFYCKHNDSERDNFTALARSLLTQCLKQDKALLLYYYEKCCNSGQTVLTSPDVIEELLDAAFKNCKRAYIIIDGLDECSRDQRKIIAQWFRNLIQELPTTEPDRLRCLFVSQDDGVARKDFSGLTNITIRPEDNKHDIDEYCRIEAEKLKETFSLSSEEILRTASTVAGSVGGLFLLARLIWINLSNSTSIAQLQKELEPNNFPKEINDAYRRIMNRINEQASPARKDDTLMLMGWLVYAKRSLKWNEIQGLKSIHLDEQRVDFERHRFVISPKDICASLVEVLPDGSLEFVHLTVKFFLLDEKHIHPSAEIKLAHRCIDYLNLPAFVNPPTEIGILNGEYGFMDYAVLYWVQHLEAGALYAHDHTDLMRDLAESLENFIYYHSRSPTSTLVVSERTKERLRFFDAFEFHDVLGQIVVSTKRQLRSSSDLKKDEIALDLVDVVADVRKILEEIISRPMEASVQQGIEEKYGINLFKCPQFSCRYFTEGFSSARQLEDHISRHDRPFRCADENCMGFVIGFASAVELSKHMRTTHSPSTSQDDEFPTDEEVRQSVHTETIATVHEVEPEPVVQLQHFSPQKKSNNWICWHCSKTFTKRYNLASHLLSHEKDHGYSCDYCEKDFARKSDYTRHLGIHTGVKEFICHGVLKNGDYWGCGKTFSRKDILTNHFKSKIGQSCRLPLLQEQGQSISQTSETQE